MMRYVDPRFGVRLRELREDRGLSLRRLPKLVPCSHVQVHHLEKGVQAATPRLASRLDEALGAGGELAALATTQREESRNAWEPRAESFGRRDAEALAESLTAETPTSGNALRLAHEWMVSEPPQVYELRFGRRVGRGTVDRVEQRVHQLRLVDDHIGGRDSYKVITAELAATASLLREGSYTEQVGRGLLVVMGELAQLAGWVASDAGRHSAAEHYYLTGARASHAGGDIAGAANNLSCMSYQMSNIGDRCDAVVLARTAVCRAEKQATATARALLLERVAWAHARAGEAGACDRALGEVEDAYSGRNPADDPAWVYWLDTDEIAVMAGRCWTELERPLRAVPVLRQVMAGYGADRARESALYRSWLAEALLQAHEVEEAAQTALQALALAPKTQSSRVYERIAVIRQRLGSVRGVRAVDEFEEAYRSSVS